MSESEFTAEQIQEIRAQMLEALARDPKDVEASLELVCADTLLCEMNLRSQDEGWRNYELCKEIVGHILPVIHSRVPEVYETGIKVCQRAAETLFDHPRLKWRLLKYALDTRISCGMEPDFNLEHQVNYLVVNILHSDNGNPEKIKSEKMLKSDPVEWSKEYEDVIHLAQEKAYAELADMPRGMGFCHAYWPTLRRILHDDYGIDWRHPGEMNPGVIFD